jgi:hypothetical protein
MRFASYLQALLLLCMCRCHEWTVCQAVHDGDQEPTWPVCCCSLHQALPQGGPDLAHTGLDLGIGGDICSHWHRCRPMHCTCCVVPPCIAIIIGTLRAHPLSQVWLIISRIRSCHRCCVDPKVREELLCMLQSQSGLCCKGAELMHVQHISMPNENMIDNTTLPMKT